MIIDVVTIFPDMFRPVLEESILKRAREKGLVRVNLHDLRDYSEDQHKKVDAPSYGGGGMVFTPQPLFTAVEALTGALRYPREEEKSAGRVILLSPQGKNFSQRDARRYLEYERLILLAPRYEGVDERVRRYAVDEEVSIGDYVLSGGELAAMVCIDCVVRLIPGVVSDRTSVREESFERDLLDWPHYTRPEDFRGLKVPPVLRSGDHARIREWRESQARQRTQIRRPDLLKDHRWE
ncbi:MAG: tRNA (guanosine(37)-N1)-methyltransferase TrmD [Candidatus Omnitrophica bacterium]|nr:tRNA (guanosine(37)-N1)-methyltransferase TrmD [Candidatus Omnitrophota bacterium]